MLGLLGIFQGVMGLIWGGEYQAYPTSFSRDGISIAEQSDSIFAF